MPPTERTRVRRLPERGLYEREAIHAILDEALVCHLACAVEGHPRVIPTIHARVGDTLYLHGSAASRTLRTLRGSIEACVVATIIDGLVLARSAFHHSMNYRSAIVYGVAREVTEREEQLRAALALTEHVAPGRGTEARMPNDEELRQTTMLAIPIAEASAKVRTGPPKDDEEDLGLPLWAGVLTLSLAAGPPVPSPDLSDGINVPAYLTDYHRPGGN